MWTTDTKRQGTAQPQVSGTYVSPDLELFHIQLRAQARRRALSVKQMPHHRVCTGNAAVPSTTREMMPNTTAKRLQCRRGNHVQPMGSWARKVATAQHCAVHARRGKGAHHVHHIQPRLGVSSPVSTASQRGAGLEHSWLTPQSTPNTPASKG